MNGGNESSQERDHHLHRPTYQSISIITFILSADLITSLPSGAPLFLRVAPSRTRISANPIAYPLRRKNSSEVTEIKHVHNGSNGHTSCLAT
jgi:hypothetical protein